MGQGDDLFAYQNSTKFSTVDNDNDPSRVNCAVNHKSGWWYHACHYININEQPPKLGLASFAEMKICPLDCSVP